MGKWAEPNHEKEFLKKLRKIFNETKEKTTNNSGVQFTFEDFLESFDENDKSTKRALSEVIKNQYHRHLISARLAANGQQHGYHPYASTDGSDERWFSSTNPLSPSVMLQVLAQHRDSSSGHGGDSSMSRSWSRRPQLHIIRRTIPSVNRGGIDLDGNYVPPSSSAPSSASTTATTTTTAANAATTTNTTAPATAPPTTTTNAAATTTSTATASNAPATTTTATDAPTASSRGRPAAAGNSLSHPIQIDINLDDLGFPGSSHGHHHASVSIIPTFMRLLDAPAGGDMNDTAGLSVSSLIPLLTAATRAVVSRSSSGGRDRSESGSDLSTTSGDGSTL